VWSRLYGAAQQHNGTTGSEPVFSGFAQSESYARTRR
jgi:hypothetical protein